MYINRINNNQNINSKAKLSLISEKNLLPKNAIQKLIEKAKTVGHPEDIINVAVNNKNVYLKNEKDFQTSIQATFQEFISKKFSHYKEITVKGSFKERQRQAFNVISDYIDNLEQSLLKPVSSKQRSKIQKK